ncbi:TRAP transporter small permease [Polynucleobacter sp.]|uniref:TRAP transporter small permease subunit n=1 Tax=Polynucleobacter sp. TaxID=2029855 RepID=UPI0025866AA1|nr:TRAP transporter small permease [Polynucleobacter sp.]MCX7237278.1 TRAP transporter small permease [Polynucleobacter sp.]
MQTSINTTVPSPARRFLDGLYALGGALSACAVFVILVLMIGASIGRQLDWRVSWINDVVAWLCASAAFLGMAYSFRNGDFVRVTLLLEAVSPPVRRWMELISLATAFVAITYLGYWAALFTYQSWEFNEIAGNMVAIPIWIPQCSFVIGSIVLVVAVIDECLCVIRGAKPSYVARVEERHARGDFSEEL